MLNRKPNRLGKAQRPATPNIGMKRIACALLLSACFVPLHADSAILVNSSFADGRAHWGGDAKDPDSADSAALSMSGSGNSGGVIIALKKDKWTKIYQTFTVRSKKLYYTITFQLSDDYKLSETSSDYTQADLGDIPGMTWQWPLPENAWSVVVDGGAFAQKIIQPDLSKKADQQTVSGHLSELSTDLNAVFVLAFPPGEGTVTLHKVALSNTDPGGDSNP